MIVAAQSVAGTLTVLVVVGALVGIPISIALVNNRRHAEATKYAHMEGWAQGTPLSQVVAYRGDGCPTSTPGPRIVAYGVGPKRTAIRLVNGPPPPRSNPTESLLGGPPIVVVPRPGVEEEGEQRADDDHVASENRLPDVTHDSSSVLAIDDGIFFIPPVPAPPAGGTAEVQVLGHPRVLGWITEPSRRNASELACYLSLHNDRPVTQDEARMALGSGDLDRPDASAQTVRNAMSMLRKCLGRELVPEVGKIGYRLSEQVTSDWQVFQETVASATKGSSEELNQLVAALAKVRGAPFEGVTAGSFAWAWSELWVARIETAVVDSARRAASLALASGDPDIARWAALQGLLAVPNDHQLWMASLQAAATRGAE